MRELNLVRNNINEKRVVGTLSIPNGRRLYTLERPWLDNAFNVSCVPDGSYVLEWDQTGRIRGVPRLRDTNPRTQINIHSANRVHELQGCIAVGFGLFDNNVLTNSVAAMETLMEYIGGPVGEDGAHMWVTLVISSMTIKA